MRFGWSHAWQVLAVFGAGLVGGAVNSIAGGGSVITFPTLLFVGVRPILANATNTVAIWPASLAGAFGFRRELRDVPRSMLLLLVPSLAGGTIGALALLHTPSSLFEHLAPYLVLVASVLLALQPRVSRRLRGDPERRRSRRWWAAALVVQLAVAIYGGYFGAGIGIMMLAALGLIGFTDIHAMNALKNTLATFINGAALVYFVASGAVVWSVAVVMLGGSIIGGVSGASLAHHVGRRGVRRAIVVIGIAMTAALLVRVYL